MIDIAALSREADRRLAAKPLPRCHPRKRFATDRAAGAAAYAVGVRGGPYRPPYACQYCNGWHLS